MLTKEDLKNAPVLEHFRLRGTNGTRMDGLTDGVFALSIAVLLISSQVPQNYDELLQFIYDLLPFSICIVFIYWIWSSLSNFNMQYGMQDSKTSHLKMILLFFVLFYVYPLKFLMTWQTKYFAAIFSGKIRERYHEINGMIPFEKLPELMIIYGIGFSIIFFILYWLYKKAYINREVLQLNEREVLETQFSMRQYLSISSVGVISIILAFVSILLNFPLGAIAAGVVYNLIWVFAIYEVKYEKRKLAELGFSNE